MDIMRAHSVKGAGMERATLIIPCYNEARRLDTQALGTLLDARGVTAAPTP